jgi:hypothetical protein|tara:strand:+ start:235 stop:537 length:303 start_codon:yes stop_codon:yes gene_type:complete
MAHKIISVRMATWVWAVASAATMIALGASLDHLPGRHMLPLFLPVVIIMLVASIKAWLILRFYLGLRNAQGSWAGLFVAFLTVIVMGVVSAQGAIILIGQ